METFFFVEGLLLLLKLLFEFSFGSKDFCSEEEISSVSS